MDIRALRAEAYDALMAGGRELFADAELCAAACELLAAINAADAWDAGWLLRDDGAVVTVDGRLLMAPEDVREEMAHLL